MAARALRHRNRLLGYAGGRKTIAFEGEEFIGENPFFAANRSQIAELEGYMDSVRKSLDSVGARLHIEARQVPVAGASRCSTAWTPTSPTR